MSTNLSTKHIHILRHSLGLDEKGHGREYRNYYCSGFDCDGHSDIAELVSMGLMDLGRVDGKNRFYYLTDAGKDEARKGVVFTVMTRSQRRFQAYRQSDCGLSFREWLKTKWAKI